jgi:hypothetical protein
MVALVVNCTRTLRHYLVYTSTEIQCTFRRDRVYLSLPGPRPVLRHLVIEIHHPSHAAIPVDHPPHSDDAHYSSISSASPAPSPATLASLVLTGTLPYSKETLRTSQHHRVEKRWDPGRRINIGINAEASKIVGGKTGWATHQWPNLSDVRAASWSTKCHPYDTSGLLRGQFSQRVPLRSRSHEERRYSHPARILVVGSDDDVLDMDP